MTMDKRQFELDRFFMKNINMKDLIFLFVQTIFFNKIKILSLPQNT